MTLSKRIQRLEQRFGGQGPDVLFMPTFYEQRKGPNIFGRAMAFATWPNGCHQAFTAEGEETFDAFKARVEREVQA